MMPKVYPFKTTIGLTCFSELLEVKVTKHIPEMQTLTERQGLPKQNPTGAGPMDGAKPHPSLANSKFIYFGTF